MAGTAWSIPHQSREVRYLPLPAILPLQIENLIGFVTRGEKEMMKGERRGIGRLDEGRSLELGYLVLCYL